MWGARLLFYLLLLPSLVFYNQGVEKRNRDCGFITCRDCTISRCVWAIYFNGDENCVESTKGIPGVEAECDDPSKCAKPKCVIPAHNSWDAAGIAQLLGGILGGILAGLCGGVGIQSWRRGRQAGYVEIGGQNGTWRNFFQAFLRAFANGLGRQNDEAPLRGDDELDEQQRQAAARRNAQRQMDGERLDRNPEGLRNEAVDAAVNANIDDPPPAPDNRRPPQENEQPRQENRQPNEQQQEENLPRPSFEIRQPGLGMQFGPNAGHENESLPRVDAVPEVNLNLENPVVVDGNGADNDNGENDGHNESGDNDDQSERATEIDSDDNDDDDWRDADTGAVTQDNIVPRSSRAASINAAKLIATLRVNKQI